MQLLIITIGLGLASTWLARALTKLNFTTCFWYWLGWSLGIAAAEFGAWAEFLPSVTPLGHDLIIKAHIGAFIGFAVGSCFSAVTRRVSYNGLKRQESFVQVSDRIVRAGILLQFALGIILVIHRVYSLGDISGFTLLDVRSSYQADIWGLQRYATYIVLLISFLPVQFGLEDAHLGKIRARRLLLLWLSGVPAGLSTAGRGWILGPFPAYAFAYLLAKDGPTARKELTNLVRRWIPLLITMVALFNVIALLRSADFQEELAREQGLPWYQRSKSVMAVVGYLGIPVSAAGPYSEIARLQPRSYGALTFPWIASQLERLNLVEQSPYARFYSESRSEVRSSIDWRLGSTHATIIPNLVGDFGTEGVLWAMAVLMAIFQFLGVLSRNRTLFGHSLAVVCALSGGFWLFQDSMFGVGGTVVGLMFTGLFQWWYYKRVARHKSTAAVHCAPVIDRHRAPYRPR